MWITKKDKVWFIPTSPSGLAWLSSFLQSLIWTMQAELISTSLSCCFITVIKHLNRKLLGQERVCFILHFHITVHHWTKSGQELKYNPGWDLLTGLHPRACSNFFPTAPRVTCPLWGTTHGELGLLNNTSKPCPRPIWWVHFLSWSSLFPNNSNCVKLS